MRNLELDRALDRLYRLTAPEGLTDFSPAAGRQTAAWRRITGVLLDPEMKPAERREHLVRAMRQALTGASLRPGRVMIRLYATDSGALCLELGTAGRTGDGGDLASALEGFTGRLRFAQRGPELPAGLRWGGYLSGVPAVFRDEEEGMEPLTAVALLEAVATGMQGQPFCLMITAQPYPGTLVKRMEAALWEELEALSPKLRGSTQDSTAESNNLTTTDGENSGSSAPESFFGTRGANHSAAQQEGATRTTGSTTSWESPGLIALNQELQREARRLRRAAEEGAWQVGVFLAAHTADGLERLGAIAGGALAGDADTIKAPYWRTSLDALQWLDGSWPAVAETDMGSLDQEGIGLYTSRELAGLMALPSREVPGFEVLPTPVFGLQARSGTVALGTILERGALMAGSRFALEPDDLLRHGLVVGMTGSGKSNTLFQLLGGLPVPFLVLEPVKTEYRSLLGAVPDLRVYTPGEERISPLRLNPFWFPPGFSIQHHVDSLKALFAASFSMYGPMPNILEQCLYAIYTVKGWSLQYSTNVYATAGRIGMEHYPTLADLYQQIDQYLTRSGYAEEQKQNIRSALLTRLQSLMTGGKGLLLNTTDMTPSAELFGHPTVIELDAIPDDDEKALVIGLLMIRLYEHLKMSQQRESESLRHLLVVEEAHRVFRNVQRSNNPEVADPQGKMVELLSNMLAEIRAYGQGVLVVEQVPSKLSPDAVKNTNLKIVHRLVSRDDCEYMATALTITAEESQFCARLQRGEALVFLEGMNRPVQLLVDPAKLRTERPSPDQVRRSAEDWNPVLLRGDQMHPLAEVIWHEPAAAAELMGVVRAFARNLLFDDVLQLHACWTAGMDEVLHGAEAAGYDVAVEDPERLAHSLLRTGLTALVQGELHVAKNLRLATFLGAFLQRGLELSMRPYEQQARAVDQLGVVRDHNLHADLARFYAATFRRGSLRLLHLHMAPSPVDGEAAAIVDGWATDELAQSLRGGESGLGELVGNVRNRVVSSFIVPPTAPWAVERLTAKVVALVLGEHASPAIIAELNRRLPLGAEKER